MFNLNSYGELVLDDCNRFDFEFPLAKAEYENAVEDMVEGYLSADSKKEDLNSFRRS